MRFVSDLSIWWLIPWFGVSFFLAHFLYKDENWVKELGHKWIITFKALRTSGIFLLGILFIGVLFEAVSYRVEKPVFISLIDNNDVKQMMVLASFFKGLPIVQQARSG